MKGQAKLCVCFSVLLVVCAWEGHRRICLLCCSPHLCQPIVTSVTVNNCFLWANHTLLITLAVLSHLAFSYSSGYNTTNWSWQRISVTQEMSTQKEKCGFKIDDIGPHLNKDIFLLSPQNTLYSTHFLLHF